MLRIFSIFCLLLVVVGCDNKQHKAYKFSELAYGYYDLMPTEKIKCSADKAQTETCANIEKIMLAVSFGGLDKCLNREAKTVDHGCVDAVTKKRGLT
jgi:hypothetical protein